MNNEQKSSEATGTRSPLARRLVFLLVGRTGVGKSSTINSLMGSVVSPVGHYSATTRGVQGYESAIDGIPYVVFDTPGFTEDPSKDRSYVGDIQREVGQIDCLWFVTGLLTEARIGGAERKTISLITESFGADVWARAVIVFTFADKVSPESYEDKVNRWTELLKSEIGRQTNSAAASLIPAVAVANGVDGPIATPDGSDWLSELYKQVFIMISIEAAIPFYLTAKPLAQEPSSNSPNAVLSATDVEVIFGKAALSAPVGSEELSNIYQQTRAHARGWYIGSLTAAFTGFALLVAAIAVAMLRQTPQVSMVSGIAGVISEIVAALFFRQSRAADRRVDAVQEKLAEGRELYVAVGLVNSIDDPVSRNTLKAQIAQQLVARPRATASTTGKKS